MAITLQITDGTTTFDMVYDSSTQPYYHSRKGLLVVSEDTDVLQHRPDDGEPVPIRGNDMDRTVVFDSDVLGSSQDEVLNKITALKRFIDGKDQQALRYWTAGDVDRVDLKIQLENATNYTLNPIKWGHVDDSGAHYKASSQNTGYAIGIRVTLHLTAYGEGAAITLRNDLASSPHMLQDSNADGLADGLVAVGTLTSKSISTTNYVIGGKSQRWVPPTTGDSGIRFADVTYGAPGQGVFSVWVTAGSGADPLTIRLSDGSEGLIEEKTFNRANPTGYDDGYVFTDPAGGTWYRYTVSGVNAAANFRPRVYRTSANASAAVAFFVDGAYLKTGTTTTPTAWCSTSAIKNRYDPAATSAATEAQINYLDVWGVPGDSDALATIAVDATSGTNIINYISRITGNNVTDIAYWRESDQFSSVSGSWSAGTGTSDDHYFRLASASASGTMENAEDWQYLVNQLVRVFVIARSSSTTPTIQVRIAAGAAGVGGSVIASTEAVSVSAANVWKLLDLGHINLIDYADSTSSLYEQVVVADATSQTVDFDAVIFFPVRDEYMAVAIDDLSGSASTTNDFTVYGVKEQVRGFDGLLKQANGSMWYLKSGGLNRYIFMFTSDSGTNILTTAATTTLTVYPRTRHLLGTA